MSGIREANETIGSRLQRICDHENEGWVCDSDDANGMSVDSDARFEGFEYDEQKALRALAKFVCSANVPPTLVEDSDFRELAHKFNPLFQISVSEVESECMKIYEERKETIKEILGNFDGQISLSMEILKYYNLRNFLCLSAHFIDENWKLRKWVLYFRCVVFPCDDCDSEEDLSDDVPCQDWEILKSLEDWGIKDKISTFIMTNGYGCVAENVKSRIQENKELCCKGQQFRGFRLYCCGEMVSEMVQDAFGKITDIINKVRALCSSVKSLPLWNHTIFDLKQALKMWTMGEFSSKQIIINYDIPSLEEWKKVEGVCKIVGSVYEVSHALFETKHLTANVYLYHLHELREVLTNLSADSDSFIRTIAEDMLKKFGKYWDDMFLLLAITAVLDPRLKMKYVEFVCSKVTGRDENSQVADVLGAIHKQFDEYVTRFPEKENFMSDSSSSDSDSEGGSPIPGHVNYSFGVLQDYHQFIQSSNQPTKRSDLDWYLEEPVLPWRQEFSALTWWRTAGAKYPTLSRMARDFLAIPLSLATSYEAFYTEPRPVNEHIIRLKPDLGNALMCTRSWYHTLKEY